MVAVHVAEDAVERHAPVGEELGAPGAVVVDPREERRRAIVADISDREVAVAILAHLGLPTEAPPMARARSPAFEVA